MSNYSISVPSSLQSLIFAIFTPKWYELKELATFLLGRSS